MGSLIAAVIQIIINSNKAGSTHRDRDAPPPQTKDCKGKEDPEQKVVAEQNRDIIKCKHSFELSDQTGRQVLGCNERNGVFAHSHSLTAQLHAESMKAFPFYYA